MTESDPSDRPRVSVLMSVLAPAPHHLREAVDSVLAQTIPDWELVLVETESERSALAALPQPLDPRVRHVLLPRGCRLSKSRNTALHEARAPVVALLDGDDIAEPDRLERQLEFLDRNGDIAVVGSSVTLIDGRGAAIGERRYPTRHAAIRAAMKRFNPIAQPSVAARRDVLLRHGGYRERDGAVCEDYELWSHLARAGERFANLDEPLLRYRLHADSTKSRRVKATLRDTLWIKRTYWSEELDLAARARMAGESLLQLLPAPLVHALFVRWTSSTTRGVEA